MKRTLVKISHEQYIYICGYVDGRNLLCITSAELILVARALCVTGCVTDWTRCGAEGAATEALTRKVIISTLVFIICL